ncbi:MAG: HNH endonuclease [Acidimicrobiales bacterium]
MWSCAQRRAAQVRDGGHCRFPGCERRIADLHHLLSWSDGDPTDLDNGLLACPRHHGLLHRGFYATGEANHTLDFHRPDGTFIGSTRARGS